MDWQSIPVRLVPLSRFVIPLHDISVEHLRTDYTGEPVCAFSRWADAGDVWVSDGRHRVLRALLRGDTHIDTRLLVLP
jgi:hypothetical protein